MPLSAYPAYLEAAIVGYAEDNAASGRWPKVGSIERSREGFTALLPQGLETPDNFLFEILQDEDDLVVGYIWYALECKFGNCEAYVYDLEVKAAHRHKGHARDALNLLQLLVARDGATSLGLNVFANNIAAQALYQGLGYEPTNINMRKQLAKSYA